MKRSQSRTGSPTGTVFSGISNYKNDAYRSGGPKSAPAVPTVDYRAVSKIHYEELVKYLAVYLSTASPESRSNARQKLTRLTSQQFHELSTDVYDELCRRKKDKDMVPFLPVKEEFHPKRNQARQKLATLATGRFEDLSSDVYYELIRRYPEFEEEPPTASSVSNYNDDYPSPDYPSPDYQPQTAPLTRSNTRPTEDDSGYGGSRRPSEDRRRPSEQYDPVSPSRRSDEDRGYPSSGSSRRKPSQDLYSPRRTSEEDRGYVPGGPSSRRKPSQDTTRSGYHGRQQSAGGASDSTTTVNAMSTTAGSGMVIPTKSTITEEVIEVPYGRDRDGRGSTSTINDDLDDDPLSARSPVGGLNGLSARLRQDDDDDVVMNGNGRKNSDYYDRSSYGRGSISSERSPGGISYKQGGRNSATGNHSATEDQERLKKDYEFKIATMQNQISSLQRDLNTAGEAQESLSRSEDRVSQLEEELSDLRRRTEEQSTAMRALNKELDDVRESRLQERDRHARREQEDEAEIRGLRERIEDLENSEGGAGDSADSQVVEQLRNDIDSLFADLTDLSRRNDDLQTEKEQDMATIRELDNQLKEYKRKYEHAKTELRSSRATSQLYMQGPKLDRSTDLLPNSPDGGLLDVHITAFLSGIDALLAAGRSNAPSGVLSPMKSVIHAATSLVDDLRSFEDNTGRDQLDGKPLSSLRERAEATLSNLVTAAKTHSTSSGMSPVSLLDAAASHLSAAVTDMAKTVNIRKATTAEQEQFTQLGSSTHSGANGFSPTMKSIEEVRNGSVSHLRKASNTSTGSSSRRGDPLASPLSARQPLSARHQTPTNDQASSPRFGGGSENAWMELKPYLEAQTESIVYAIQSVLSGVRSPTPPPSLDENVTQIITIVSSIVAVCNDNLPPTSAQQGQEILRELSEHANRLSEVQASGENTKESRQVMAKSSFAVANGMKGLMRL